ncbi:MAG: hypothetical protein ACREUE_03485 [Panacagrimonas sp.]
MNAATLRSLALSALAAMATLMFAVLSTPTEANGLCLQREVPLAQLFAPRIEGRMVQVGMPGMAAVVFANQP